ncbi:MAG: hypothetical protein ACYSWO_29970 [Planctomycetota bacterium]|jgi:hypothetical protein
MGYDYGNGKTNVSDVRIKGSGLFIRFGVISQNEVLQAWCDSSMAFYGSPHCPECGVQLDDDVCDGHECECGYEIGWVGDECYGDEPLSFYVDDGEYSAESDSYGDIFLTKSPYYTVCGYCSPCAPGAGYLTDDGEDCAAFCFGPDWFDGPVPHDIHEVSTGRLVCAKGTENADV